MYVCMSTVHQRNACHTSGHLFYKLEKYKLQCQVILSRF